MSILNILGSPWAITSDKLSEITGIYRTHLRGEKIDISAIESKLGKPLANKYAGLENVNGVGVINVEGVLGPKMNLFMQVSGGASTQMIANDFKKAIADPSIKSILLMIDSPGGTVTGTQELAQLIFGSRGEKPIVAFSNSVMASAAYYIAAAADRVFISGDNVQVGSIGVILSHVDQSQSDLNSGLKTTIMSAGAYKAIGNPSQPLSADGQAYLQSLLDDTYATFIHDVGVYRGVSAEVVHADMADGRLFQGQDAIKAGLVDGVSTLDQLLSDMSAGVAGAYQVKPQTGATTNMPNIEAKTGADAAGITLEGLKASHPSLFESIRAIGFDDGVRAGAASESSRIKAVEAQALPGHEKLIESLKFDGKTTGPDAAAQVLQAEKGLRATALSTLRTEAHLPLAQPSAPALSAPKQGLDPASEEGMKGAWDGDAKLQGEFAGNFAAYVAYQKADAKGQVKYKGGN